LCMSSSLYYMEISLYIHTLPCFLSFSSFVHFLLSSFSSLALSNTNCLTYSFNSPQFLVSFFPFCSMDDNIIRKSALCFPLFFFLSFFFFFFWDGKFHLFFFLFLYFFIFVSSFVSIIY
jgi:hypothetical protein